MTPDAADRPPAHGSLVSAISPDEDRWRTTLEQSWDQPRGLLGWFRRVDHRSIGRRAIVTAMVFFALGGLLALAMRLQLARPENHLIGPDLYNQLFTMHGSTMMFLFAVPVMQALGIYLVPLMVGAREIAFPRLIAFSYWMYLFGGIFLYVAFALNIGPDAGWFTYVPLAGPAYGVGKRVDIWAQLINYTEISAITTAIGLIVTILKLRAPGMSLNRLPLFVWAILIMSLMIIFAMPAIITGSLFLATDRLVGTQFYNQAEGGDALLWQHLFWFFGHPEVYIIFVPGLGIISAIITTFCRRQVFAYPVMVLSIVATGFLGFGLWVHHMFATPLPQMGQSFFTAASIMIAIPTGVQMFCWIATIWAGRPRFHTPLLFVAGFFGTFILGGMTGVMAASVPLDWQLHDTMFIVAHLHYVLIGGAVFPLFGGFYYWFPKMTGRVLSERLGKINFWLLFIGFNTTFYPLHHLGLQGMPRRVYTYVEGVGWGRLNLLATIGACIIGLAVIAFVANVAVSLRRGEVATDNPWDADTLEWATSSPPPVYGFLHPPVVVAREGLWAPALREGEARPIVVGLSNQCREVLVTYVLDASPDHRVEFPGPTWWPFITALTVAVIFIGSLFTPWAVVWGGALATIAAIGWFWPREVKPPFFRGQRRALAERHA
jgi:cytochrome c oxidase subunit I+III